MSDFIRQLYKEAAESGSAIWLEAAKIMDGFVRGGGVLPDFTFNLTKGVRKQSSPELSKLAAQVLRDPKATAREKRLAASVLSQDETSGQS